MEWCQIGLYDVWGMDTLRDMEEYFGSKRAHWAWSCVSVWRMGNGQLINVWKDQWLLTPITNVLNLIVYHNVRAYSWANSYMESRTYWWSLHAQRCYHYKTDTPISKAFLVTLCIVQVHSLEISWWRASVLAMVLRSFAIAHTPSDAILMFVPCYS